MSGVQNEAIFARLTALRDSFIAEVEAAGFKPRLPGPSIVLGNPPSLGYLDEEKNDLHIAVWEAVPAEAQAQFKVFASMLGGGETDQSVFEGAVHRWIFIHELSHWWLCCRNENHGKPYAVEMGANRIGTAYWREKDSQYMDLRALRSRMTKETLPTPVPTGQSPIEYFNDNYHDLARRTPAYAWYQAGMLLEAYNENPVPTFGQVLQRPV